MPSRPWKNRYREGFRGAYAGLTSRRSRRYRTNGLDQPLARLARAIDRRLKPTLDAFTNGLAIETELAGNR